MKRNTIRPATAQQIKEHILSQQHDEVVSVSPEAKAEQAPVEVVAPKTFRFPVGIVVKPPEPTKAVDSGYLPARQAAEQKNGVDNVPEAPDPNGAQDQEVFRAEFQRHFGRPISEPGFATAFDRVSALASQHGQPMKKTCLLVFAAFDRLQRHNWYKPVHNYVRYTPEPIRFEDMELTHTKWLILLNSIKDVWDRPGDALQETLGKLMS